MKRLIFITVLILFINGCSKEVKLQLFETKDQAIKQYIEEQNVMESFLELDLVTNETIVLIKQEREIYSLAELANSKDNKYSFSRISAWVDIGNTTGAMWEFKTNTDNVYTLKISKKQEDPDSIYNNDFDIYISIVNGKRTYNDYNVRNIITSTKLIDI
ncbi:hypothetical protein [Paenibacillus sp. 453mf]|uniref:hypothetical protein n=1 Tax=Paenibacillus sp. 453mf TaxID=1761874 RepID=UPI0008F1C9B1|nr:hypothetical protein [Paenibacillus sp. 453mf]SFS40815.1 hypothetical protein SAMN04488601_101411 [Paenibacillus sp. 453mf]